MTHLRIRIAALTAAVLVGGLALAGCSSSTPSGPSSHGACTTPTMVTISAPPSFNALTLYVAKANGYFADNCLDFTLTPTVGAEAVPQLLNGSIQFMLADSVTLFKVAAQGLPLIIAANNVVADGPGSTGFFAVLERTADAGKYTSVKDIAGHTFGIPTIGSEPWLDVRQAVADAGGDPDAIKFVEVPNPIEALQSGQVDFVTAAEPTATAGALGGKVKILAPVTSKDLAGLVQFPYLTTKQEVAQHPDVVKGFQAAVLKANAWINANGDQAKKIAEQNLTTVPAAAIEAATLPKLGESMPTTDDLQKELQRVINTQVDGKPFVEGADKIDVASLLPAL